MKIAAASQGADVSFDEDWYEDDGQKPQKVLSAFEINHMPIGLGYEVISQ